MSLISSNASLGFLITFGSQIINAIFGYASLVVVAHLLSPSMFGTFSLVLSVLAFVSILGSFGVENLILSLLPKRKEVSSSHYNSTVTNVLFLVFLASATTFLLLYSTKNEVNASVPDYSTVVMIMGWTVPLQAIVVYLKALTQSEFMFVKAAVPQNVLRPTIFMLSVVLLLFFRSNSIKLVSASYLLSYVLTVLWAAYASKDMFIHLRLRQMEFDKEIYSSAPQFMLIQLLNQASNFIPVFLIGSTLPTSQIGVFRVTQQTTLLVSFILSSVNMVFAPKISQLYSRGEFGSLRRYYSKTTKWTFAIGGIICISVVFNANEIMTLFGASYRQWSFLLVLFSLSQLVNAATGSSGYILLMTKHQKLMMVFTLVQASVVTILTAISIKSYNLYGVVISVCIGLLIINLLQLIFVWRLLRIHPFSREYAGTFLSMAIAYGMTLLAQPLVRSTALVDSLVLFLTTLASFAFFFVMLGMDKSERSKFLNFF